MEINNINNHILGKITSPGQETESVQPTPKVGSTPDSEQTTDKVSINDFGTKKNEEMFARIEMEKLNQSSFGKLKSMKAKIMAYEQASKESPEAAAKTEIGQLLNDPDVWGSIADGILNK